MIGKLPFAPRAAGFLLFLLAAWAAGCGREPTPAGNAPLPRPATAAAGGFTPLDLAAAEALVREQLSVQNPDQPGEGSWPLVETTTAEIRERLGAQTFRVTGRGDAQSFLVRARRVLRLGASFGGEGVISSAVADLDGDGRPELFYCYSWGSGRHRSSLARFCFDGPETCEQHLCTFWDGDFVLEQGEGRTLALRERVLENGPGRPGRLLGEVACDRESGCIEVTPAAGLPEAVSRRLHVLAALPATLEIRPRRASYARLAEVELDCTLRNASARACRLCLRRVGAMNAPLNTWLEISLAGRLFCLHHPIRYSPLDIGPPGEADFTRLEPGAATSFTIRLGDYARLKSRGELPPGALFPADAVIPPEQWAETGEVRVRFLFVGQEAAPQPLPPLFTPSAAPVRETGGAAEPPAAWTGEISAAAAVTIAPGP